MKFLLCTFATVLALPLSLIVPESSAAQQATVVAVVNGQKVTNRDIISYASQSPQLMAYLRVPGGPLLVLEQLIADRLLVLEGERLGVSRPAEGEDFAYAHIVGIKLRKPCAEPTEGDALAYYQSEKAVFSTPLMLRMRRIGIIIKDDDVARPSASLQAIKQRIEAGEIDFSEAANEYSEDSFGKGRGGDVGFVPIEDGNNVAQRALIEAKADAIVGPLREADMLYIYQVTDRRKPIVEPFDRAKQRALDGHRQACQKRHFAELVAELKQRWPAEILVDEIGIAPIRPK